MSNSGQPAAPPSEPLQSAPRATPSELTASRLGELRRRLLDLTRRNRLLNSRLAARSSLRVVDELPHEVFRVLVTEGATMQFLSREEAPPEAARALADAAQEDGPARPLDDMPLGLPDLTTGAPWESHEVPLAALASGRAADRHRDNELQTALDGEALQARLTSLARNARSALEEQGSNSLYLTLGTVQWRDATPGSPTCGAPLVFVPVELRRKNSQSRYCMTSFDDEIVVNPCLVELCRRQFNVDWPMFERGEEGDLDGYFAAVEQALAQSLPTWSLVRDLQVGLFSFAKLMMYRDLDSTRWPPNASIADEALVQKLCGVPVTLADEDRRVPEPTTLDDALPPDSCFNVLDADSTQLACILAARQGKTLVIEGPPGTGKSQTITNVIAECLAAGKTVLFVAEKGAALEVVKRRLVQVGLGDGVLELHSRYSKRRAFLDELRRALTAPDKVRPSNTTTADDLAALRGRLNTTVRDLHSPQGAMAVSPFQAASRAAALAATPVVPCEVVDPLAWTRQRLVDCAECLERLDNALQRTGDLATHPWAGFGFTGTGFEQRQRISVLLEGLISSLDALSNRTAVLAESLGRSAPDTIDQSQHLIERGRWLMERPVISATVMGDDRWPTLLSDVLSWTEYGIERDRLKAQWSTCFLATAEFESWGALLERRAEQSTSWLRHVSPSWYADGRRLRAALKPTLDPSPEALLTALRALVDSARLRETLGGAAPRYRDLLGPHWEGVDGSWTTLRDRVHTVREVHRLVSESQLDWSSARAVIASTDRAPLTRAVGEAMEALESTRRAWSDWTTALEVDQDGPWSQPLGPASAGALASRLRRQVGTLDRLADWADFRRNLAQALASPARSFAHWIVRPDATPIPGQLRRAFEAQFWRLLADASLRAPPSLRSFRGDEHQVVVERFRKADQAWIVESRRRLVDRLKEAHPDLDGTAHKQSKLGLLKAQMKLRRGGWSVRKILETTGEVVQAIKPCFMMSPVSVAQYLTPGALRFDLVIFDEASQVEPADAFGAIARGRQLLLIGDDKQLPPTDFFRRSEGEAIGDDDEVATGDLESILDVGRTHLSARSQWALRWHYRSRHQSLISYSNLAFYDGRLRTFPSPHADSTELGLEWRHVENGIYRRGRGQDNPQEALAIVKEIIEHARKRPQMSLGVGAFSVAQQRMIENLLDRARDHFKDQALDAFLESAVHEPFFVKNLETIQGDERDVILLSVGYGRDESGRFTMNFGPLNRDGGWRRLNVLVTRARRRCVAFSSFRPEEMSVTGSTPRGVTALRDFLDAARKGATPAVPSSPAPAEAVNDVDELAAQIAVALESRGYRVHRSIGAAGFEIDLAVIHPDQPDRYLLGVEVDGDTYRDAATARDRDRLRHEVLINLGWSITRVWALDWFQRSGSILETLIATLEDLRHRPLHDEDVHEGQWDREAPRPTSTDSVGDSPPVPALGPALGDEDDPDADQVTQATNRPPGTSAYVSFPVRHLGDLEALVRTPVAALADLLREVVTVEGPVHIDQALRAVVACFETRAAGRARASVRKATQEAVRRGSIDLRNDFLWLPGTTVPAVRFRGGDCPVVRPEHIATEEWAQGCLLVLEREFGLDRASLAQATLRLLGYRRAGPRLLVAVEQGIEELILGRTIEHDRDGRLVRRRG